jgi:hypothetical protein
MRRFVISLVLAIGLGAAGVVTTHLMITPAAADCGPSGCN